MAETLRDKHQANILIYEQSPDELLPRLRESFPRFACFVATPNEAGRDFVAGIHRLTRKLNDDPYTDCFWGILTGYNPANALRIATQSQPLVVRKVASGTEIALDLCQEGVWYSELKAGEWVQKKPGQNPASLKGPADTTELLAKSLTEYHADLFVTSGHATERDWQIGYSYKNGTFRCEAGTLFGLDLEKRKFPIHSANPKVYLPIGNCLMGYIDGSNAMALAFLNSAGVCQMIGYTVPSWYGYAGWGCLDFFLEQPGRYTFTEAFFANHAALIHRLETYFPGFSSAELDQRLRPNKPVPVTEAAKATGLKAQDAIGLLHDRDTVAFYGDPAWQARMAEAPKWFDQGLTRNGNVFTFEIKPNRGVESFKPVNTNGSQRGGRPFLAWFPERVKNPVITQGADLNPVVTPNFILVPNPMQCDPAKTYRVKFTAEILKP